MDPKDALIQRLHDEHHQCGTSEDFHRLAGELSDIDNHDATPEDERPTVRYTVAPEYELPHTD